MAWSASKVYQATITNLMNKDAVAIDCNADAFKAALFNDTITPDNTVAAASTAYAAGVWASGGVSDASGWPAAGRSLTVTSSGTSVTYTFTSTNTASANSTTTLASNNGCLIYDDTATSPADQGICYNWFGGAQSVTSGLYTLAWNASGVFTIGL